jgi:cell division septation protein DedD
MRSEPELYKDKIEVSLDGRQIFYLFFGGAVIACLVFALGVLVGKRVEARAHVDRAATTATRDPLAALDALDATGRAAAPAPAGGQMERAVTDLDGAQRAAAAPALAPAPATTAPAATAPAAAKPSDDDPAPASLPDHDKGDHDKGDKGDHDKSDKDKSKKKKHHDDDAPAAKPDDATASAADTAHPADDHADKDHADKDKVADKDHADKDKVADKDHGDKDHADKDKEKKKSHYTLQLSSFQDKAEAQAFADSVKGAGYAPYLVEADVDGKGTFYRVRLGTYGSYDDAIDAKTDFEAKVKKVAYVTKL